MSRARDLLRPPVRRSFVAARRGLVLVAALALAGCLHDPDEMRRTLPVLGETIELSIPPDPRAQMEIRLDERINTVIAYLNVPTHRAPQGAVVLLHGCQGLDLGTSLAMLGWSEWWQARGFITLIVDSLTPRGIDQACLGADRQEVVDLAIRESDALAALAYLRQTFDLPGAQIGLHGFSHGGQAALALARGGGIGFGWAIAFYPGCDAPEDDHGHLPTLVITGADDDWTGVSHCEAMASHDGYLKLVVLPGAKHLFDQPLIDRVAFGHAVGYNPAALATAKRHIREFLKQLTIED
ncbi:MAG: dienelactone hydrolase family protein [Rhodospirillales bacterium]|nr:dienelactone hydrolase family protein [Rhodospirillales bacterium]